MIKYEVLCLNQYQYPRTFRISFLAKIPPKRPRGINLPPRSKCLLSLASWESDFPSKRHFAILNKIVLYSNPDQRLGWFLYRVSNFWTCRNYLLFLFQYFAIDSCLKFWNAGSSWFSSLCSVHQCHCMLPHPLHLMFQDQVRRVLQRRGAVCGSSCAQDYRASVFLKAL